MKKGITITKDRQFAGPDGPALKGRAPGSSKLCETKLSPGRDLRECAGVDRIRATTSVAVHMLRGKAPDAVDYLKHSPGFRDFIRRPCGTYPCQRHLIAAVRACLLGRRQPHLQQKIPKSRVRSKPVECRFYLQISQNAVAFLIGLLQSLESPVDLSKTDMDPGKAIR